MKGIPPEDLRILELLRRYGRDSMSFGALKRGFKLFFPHEDSAISYVDTGSAWVAGASPIAAEQEIAEAGRLFVHAALQAGRRACFFGVGEWFVERVGWPAWRIGEEPWWNARHWTEKVRAHASLREQFRRARAKGVFIQTLDSEALHDPASELRRAIDGLLHRWISSRSMAPLRFLVDLQPFVALRERLMVVARCEGRVVGLLSAAPVYAKEAWLFEYLLRGPLAPNGTAELLFDAGMRLVAENPMHHATLGLAPLAGPVPPGLRLARRLGARLYNFRGLQAFKAKMRPDHWEPIYLCAAPKGYLPVALYDSLRAFAGGSLWNHALLTLRRRKLQTRPK